MGEKEFILGMLKQVADSMVSFWGRHCEVAVHDLTRLEKSLVYIAGDVTKRKPGSPITDLVLKALRRDGDRVEDLPNYRTITKDGRILKSSTFFFRGKRGKVIGALCVNLDTTDFMNTIRFMEALLRTSDEKGQNHRETFASSVNETIASHVEQIAAEIGRQPSSMTTEERVQFVKTTIFLADLNHFSAVNKVYAQYFSGVFPARSTVQVSALPKGAEIEVEAVVYLSR